MGVHFLEGVVKARPLTAITDNHFEVPKFRHNEVMINFPVFSLSGVIKPAKKSLIKIKIIKKSHNNNALPVKTEIGISSVGEARSN